MKKILPVILFTFFSNCLFAQTPSIQWEKSYGGSGYDGALSVQQTFDGGYIIVGFDSSADGDLTVNYGGWDCWIIKISSSGSIQWKKSLGGSYDDVPHMVRKTTDSGYIIAGWTSSTDGDVVGNHGSVDAWIIKLSSSGNVQWKKCYGGSGDDDAEAIQQTPDGGYIVAGFSGTNDGDVTSNEGGRDNWIIKLNDTGAIQWQKSLGGSGVDNAYSLKVTPDGGYIIVGGSYSTDGDLTGNHGGEDCWIVKLSSTGSLQWQKSLGGSSDDEGWDIQLCSDGGYIVVGMSISADGEVTGNHGNFDFWAVKLSGPAAVGTLNNNSPIAILPNPTKGNVFVQGADNVTIKIYNVIGQLMKEAKNTGNISISELPTGIYFIKLFNDQNQFLYQDKILKE